VLRHSRRRPLSSSIRARGIMMVVAPRLVLSVRGRFPCRVPEDDAVERDSRSRWIGKGRPEGLMRERICGALEAIVEKEDYRVRTFRFRLPI